MGVALAKLGDFLARNQKLIRLIQWVIIIFYACLIIIPTLLPLPKDSATLINNFTVFAQFMFWGIWWPFVLLSIVFFGRMWCGILCPEGSLSEFANRFGKKKAIPRWMKWGGWPFVTFILTTLYGQMTSVYQYPKPVLLVLGGSTVAAIIIGLIYGKESRIWCKYLCPVTGVFSLLAKLSPYRYSPDKTKWDNSPKHGVIPIHCPTVLPLRTMNGASDCLMCSKCSSHRNAIELKWRSPNEEVLKYGNNKQSIWSSFLLIYGLCGIALAAFQWTNSFWLNHIRDVVESWFLVHNIMWVFDAKVPWWIFTSYPEQHDVFSWIFGFELVAYILGIGFVIGSISFSLICLATLIVNKKFQLNVFNHMTQAMIPLGACSVFVGLSALTISLLEKYANKGFVWTPEFKAGLLAIATLWSIYLSYKIICQYTKSIWRKILSLAFMISVYAIVNYSWVLQLHIWTIKSDKIPWSTLWVPFN